MGMFLNSTESKSCCLTPENPSSVLCVEQWCCGVLEVSCTALTYVSWLVFYLQAGSISHVMVPHQSFDKGDAASLVAHVWWYQVSAVEDIAEFLPVFALGQLPES